MEKIATTSAINRKSGDDFNQTCYVRTIYYATILTAMCYEQKLTAILTSSTMHLLLFFNGFTADRIDKSRWRATCEPNVGKKTRAVQRPKCFAIDFLIAYTKKKRKKKKFSPSENKLNQLGWSNRCCSFLLIILVFFWIYAGSLKFRNSR